MDIREQLIKEFDTKEIKWRILDSGNKKDGSKWAKACKYVDARVVQKRLDDVFGWENWENDTTPVRYIDNKGKEKSGFISKIYVNYEGKTINKTDVADLTDFASFKGGASDAFKRAASSGFGIGRYLYEEDAVFVELSKKRDSYFTEYAKLDGSSYYWAIPGTKKQNSNSYNSVDNKGNKTIITDENPIIEDKHVKCIYAKTREIMLSDDDIKEYIKRKFNKEHRKDIRIEQFKVLMNYIDTLITKKEHQKLIDLTVNKGKTVDDIKLFVNIWNLPDIRFMTKKHLKILNERLNALPDAEGLPVNSIYNQAEPVQQDVKALFATN